MYLPIFHTDCHERSTDHLHPFSNRWKTKTRLISHLGEMGAAELQRMMTEYTVRQARRTGARIEVRYTGGSDTQMRKWLGEDLGYSEQGGGDLGARMQRAFEEAFSNGWKKVVLIGSDCPSNGWKNIQKAFQSLETHDCVIGPAHDGGYYLVGLSQYSPQLFQNITWGGELVFEQTMKTARGLTLHQLPKLHDVDLPEDIPPKISVIIPTLNEEAHLFQTLDKVSTGFNLQIIVVDGGSTDGTRTLFPEVLECKGGRAEQQNMGAAAATGKLLLFLHADTELPEGWDWRIRKTLADPAVALGAFSFKIREAIPGRGFIENSANYRSRVWKSPYGDQGLFLRAEDFNEVDGFPDQPIMEDYALVHMFRKRGLIITVPEPATTSGRRWQQHGVLKVTIINKLMIVGYKLGISPVRLARLYRRRSSV